MLLSGNLSSAATVKTRTAVVQQSSKMPGRRFACIISNFQLLDAVKMTNHRNVSLIKQKTASIDTRNAGRDVRKSCSTEGLSLNDAEPRIIERVSIPRACFRSYFVSEKSRGTAQSFIPYSRKS